MVNDERWKGFKVALRKARSSLIDYKCKVTHRPTPFGIYWHLASENGQKISM